MSDLATAHNESAPPTHNESGSFPISITVFGHPEPAGSKRALPMGGKKGGRPIVVDANPKAKGWKNMIAASAGIQYLGPALRGALVVEFIFYAPRPKAHFGTGRNAEVLKDSAPAYPMKRPDVLKLARAVEDALTGVVWIDDSQIVDEHIGKRFGEKEGVEIRVWPAASQTVLDLVSSGAIGPPKPTEQFEQLSLVA